MKWIAYAALFVLITALTLIVTAPLSFVMERARQSAPAISYAATTGTIWNGDVNGLRYGVQSIGNVSIRTQWTALLVGQLKSDFQLTDGGVVALGNLTAGLSGALSLNDVQVRGRTSDLMTLREEVRALDGEFTLNLSELVVKSGNCQRATGRVWTDTLGKLEPTYGWAGPELSGPISCENGKIAIRLSSPDDEADKMRAELLIGLDATGTFRAEIDNPTNDVAQAATILGFVTIGDQMVYEHVLTNAQTGATR